MKKILIILSALVFVGCDKSPAKPDYFSKKLADVELAYEQRPEDINKPDAEDTTPLVNAIINNDVNIVKFLLASNADPNYIPNQETEISPLGYAALSKTNKSDIIKILVENGADVNGHTNNGITPIMHSMVSSDNHPNIENIKTLLSYKPDVNVVDNSGYPVLFWAINHTNDMSDIIKLLIEHGANLNRKYHDGGTTILTQAIHFGEAHINNIRTLIDGGENVNLLTDNKWSALMEAVSKKDKNIIQLLLENGADINIITTHGDTGLMYLARDENDTSELIRLFIKSGADINKQNEFGHTPLFFAAEHGHKNNIQTLLELGANPKITENDGSTALMKAIFAERPTEIIRILTKYIDMNQVNRQGATALCVATANQQYETIKILVDNGADLNQYCDTVTPLILATNLDNLHIIKYLVEHGADVNFTDSEKWTPLTIAAERGQLDIVKYLAEHGANIDYDLIGDLVGENKDIPIRWTALNKAIQRNHLDVAKYLISKGASLDGIVTAANLSFDIDTMRYVADISTDKSVKKLKKKLQTCDTFMGYVVEIISRLPEEQQKLIAGSNYFEATNLYVYLYMLPHPERLIKLYGTKTTNTDLAEAFLYTVNELDYRNLLFAKATKESIKDIADYFAKKTNAENSIYLKMLMEEPIAMLCTTLDAFVRSDEPEDK